MTFLPLQEPLPESGQPGHSLVGEPASVASDADTGITVSLDQTTTGNAAAAADQRHEHVQAPPAGASAGPAGNQHGVAPDIILLDFSDVPSDEEAFIAQKAVLGALDQQPGSRDWKETDLLQRIWRAGEDIGHPYAEILDAKNPSYVKIRIKEIIAILENIASLTEELDRYRQSVVGELVHQFGLANCPILHNAEGVTLADSDRLLENFFLNRVCGLDRIILECRTSASILRYTNERLLRGTDGDRRFGLDRRGWEAEFRSFVIFAERHGSRLRQKMVERRLGFERAAKWRKKELEKAPSVFAVAKDVAKATKVTLQ